jgi:hypothetical protein
MMYNWLLGGTKMRRTNIYLEDEKLLFLKLLAAEEGKSVAELVRTAVDQWIDARLVGHSDWAHRLDSLVHRVRDRIPSQIRPEEIEDDITAARAEVRP